MPASKRIAKAQGKRPRPELALEPAYRKTTYAADIDGVTHAIRVGRRHRTLDAQLRSLGSTTWACITAWNPQSQRLSTAENKRRERLLKHAFRERQIRWHPMQATGDGGDWPTEQGLLAVGISRTVAKSVGRKFGQVAVVCGRIGEKAELVWTSPLRREGH